MRIKFNRGLRFTLINYVLALGGEADTGLCVMPAGV
jgi:hypothetical protein